MRAIRLSGIVLLSIVAFAIALSFLLPLFNALGLSFTVPFWVTVILSVMPVVYGINATFIEIEERDALYVSAYAFLVPAVVAGDLLVAVLVGCSVNGTCC